MPGWLIVPYYLYPVIVKLQLQSDFVWICRGVNMSQHDFEISVVFLEVNGISVAFSFHSFIIGWYFLSSVG